MGRVTESEKRRALASAAIYCAPNLSGESFGIVVAEGMAAGCAVVASGLPAFSRVVGDAGVLVAPGDEKGLAAAITTLLDDPDRAATLGAAARQQVRQFDGPVVAAGYVSAYEDAIDLNRDVLGPIPVSGRYHQGMELRHLNLSIADGIARLTLNRPERRNALSLELMKELLAVLDGLNHDPGARVIVISGAGPVFSSGHDLGEMIDRDGAFYDELFTTCTDVMLRLQELPQPVIAQVHGTATAAGCQLVAACDLAVASEDARFATPGVHIGLFCSTPMVPLTRAVGRKRAMQMLLTGGFCRRSDGARLGVDQLRRGSG